MPCYAFMHFCNSSETCALECRLCRRASTSATDSLICSCGQFRYEVPVQSSSDLFKDLYESSPCVFVIFHSMAVHFRAQTGSCATGNPKG